MFCGAMSVYCRCVCVTGVVSVSGCVCLYCVCVSVSGVLCVYVVCVC